jgi:hypothetical protein
VRAWRGSPCWYYLSGSEQGRRAGEAAGAGRVGRTSSAPHWPGEPERQRDHPPWWIIQWWGCRRRLGTAKMAGEDGREEERDLYFTSQGPNREEMYS